MNKSDLKKIKPEEVDMVDRGLEIRNVRIVQKDGTYGQLAAANPFGGQNHVPDLFKAYVDFDICHSLPQIIGPTMSGAYVGYHPQVLSSNHGGLLHQWMNLRHQVKANDPEGNTRDRIVGCIIAAHFPPTPPQGWKIPDKGDDAPCITARAVLFKLAEGMNRVIGDSMTSRQPWSVSIEVDATFDNIGIYLPSSREIWPLMDAPDDLLAAVSNKKNTLVIGKARGQQLAFAYGNTNGKLHFRGVGMTPNPAEKTAKITSIRAEDGGELFAIAAESIEDQVLIGAKCSWDGERCAGVIKEIAKEGKMVHPVQGWSIEASADNPALKIYLPNGVVVMKRFEAVKMAA